MPATIGVKKIAESGVSDNYIAEAKTNSGVVLVDLATEPPLPSEAKILSLNRSVEMAKANQLLLY
jgi:hypothetical protein